MPYTRFQEKPFPFTPKLIKVLMLIHLSFGCMSGFFNSLLGEKLKISFVSFFGLSFATLKKGWIWQLITYIFLPEIMGSLSFYFLFTLCFDIYLLWLIGCRVHDSLGPKKTLRLVVVIPAITGLLTTLACALLRLPAVPLFGVSFSMIPLIVAFCFASPLASFNFIPTQSVRMRWVGLGLLLLYLFQDISDLQPLSFTTHTLIFVMSYLYMVLIEKKPSPFSITRRLDQFLMRKKPEGGSEKIIHLYETLSSKEQFINRTLDRIAHKQSVSMLDRLKLNWYRLMKRARP